MFASSLGVVFASLGIAVAWAVFITIVVFMKDKQPQIVREYRARYGMWPLGLGVASLAFVWARFRYDGLFGILCFWTGTHPVLDMTTLFFCGVCGPLAIWLGAKSRREERENWWATVGTYCGAIPTAAFILAVSGLLLAMGLPRI